MEKAKALDIVNKHVNKVKMRNPDIIVDAFLKNIGEFISMEHKMCAICGPKIGNYTRKPITIIKFNYENTIYCLSILDQNQ
jgi:hypothetical protein